jgi:signal transduction histidine kinase
MSHELRTPLNAVIGSAEIIEEELESGAPPHRDDIVKIKRAANHLLGLINEVLDLSKLDARRLTLDLQPHDAGVILREVRETLAPLAAANGNTLTIAVNGPGEPAMIDALRLRQCLINLAGNACKFTRNGHIAITAHRRKDTIDFVVKDTGPGIAPEDQAKLFQPFTQADSSLSRKHEGAGLGLAITRALAELMGGAVTLESAPGKGATFTLTIRAEIAADYALAAA